MNKKLLITCICLVFCFAVVGCGKAETFDTNQDTSKPQTAVSQIDETQSTVQSEQQTKLGLYISLGDEKFTRYNYSGEDNPAALIDGIENLTGWNLSLADEVTTGKGGITVSFEKTSSLFTGKTESNKDFSVIERKDLIFAILDSVKETMQMWANESNPDSVDVYFSASNDTPIFFEDLGVTLPIEKPYSHSELEQLFGAKEESFKNIAGTWEKSSGEGAYAYVFYANGNCEIYNADGTFVKSGYLKIVAEYENLNRYDIYSDDDEFITGFYLDSDTEFHIGNSETAKYIKTSREFSK